MAKARVLERLWRLRELEEEQSRLELEARVLDRDRAAERLASATEAVVRSRRVFADAAGDPETATRAGALLELAQARRRQGVLRPEVEEAEAEMERQRQDFLARRTGRLQVETLLDRERDAAREAEARRAQQMLDDWYGRRRPGGAARGEEAVDGVQVRSLQVPGVQAPGFEVKKAEAKKVEVRNAEVRTVEFRGVQGEGGERWAGRELP